MKKTISTIGIVNIEADLKEDLALSRNTRGKNYDRN